jgi:hypothetical protein
MTAKLALGHHDEDARGGHGHRDQCRGPEPLLEKDTRKARRDERDRAQGEKGIGNGRMGQGLEKADTRDGEQGAAKKPGPTDVADGGDRAPSILEQEDQHDRHDQRQRTVQIDLPGVRVLDVADDHPAKADHDGAYDHEAHGEAAAWPIEAVRADLAPIRGRAGYIHSAHGLCYDPVENTRPAAPGLKPYHPCRLIWPGFCCPVPEPAPARNASLAIRSKPDLVLDRRCCHHCRRPGRVRAGRNDGVRCYHG